MSLSVYFSYNFLTGALGGSKATLLAIAVGVLVYALALLALGGIDRDVLDLLPGGSRLGKVLYRLKLIRD